MPKNKNIKTISPKQIVAETLIGLIIGSLILKKFFSFFRKTNIKHRKFMLNYCDMFNMTVNSGTFIQRVSEKVYRTENPYTPNTFYNSLYLVRVRLTEFAIITISQRFSAILFTTVFHLNENENRTRCLIDLMSLDEQIINLNNYFLHKEYAFKYKEQPLDFKDYIINTNFLNLENFESRKLEKDCISIYDNRFRYFKFPFETLDNGITGDTDFSFIKLLKLSDLKIKSTFFRNTDVRLFNNKEFAYNLRQQLKFACNNLLYSNKIVIL